MNLVHTDKLQRQINCIKRDNPNFSKIDEAKIEYRGERIFTEINVAWAEYQEQLKSFKWVHTCLMNFEF